MGTGVSTQTTPRISPTPLRTTPEPRMFVGRALPATVPRETRPEEDHRRVTRPSRTPPDPFQQFDHLIHVSHRADLMRAGIRAQGQPVLMTRLVRAISTIT